MTTTDKEKAAWFILDKTIFTSMLNVAAVSLPRRENAVRILRLRIVKVLAAVWNHTKIPNSVVNLF